MVLAKAPYRSYYTCYTSRLSVKLDRGIFPIGLALHFFCVTHCVQTWKKGEKKEEEKFTLIEKDESEERKAIKREKYCSKINQLDESVINFFSWDNKQKSPLFID